MVPNEPSEGHHTATSFAELITFAWEESDPLRENPDSGEWSGVEEGPSLLGLKESQLEEHGDLAGGQGQGMTDERGGELEGWVRDHVGGSRNLLQQEVDTHLAIAPID